MNPMIWIVMALAIALVAYVIIGPTRAVAARRSVGAGPGARAEIESAEAYRNHLSMARWIELQLKDDLVRSSVPEDEQARARRLLDEFYGDER